MGNKVIAINGWWASVLASILASIVFGGIGYAFSAHAQLEILQGKINSIESSGLPERMARIEETTKNTDKSVDAISMKLDRLLERRP